MSKHTRSDAEYIIKKAELIGQFSQLEGETKLGHHKQRADKEMQLLSMFVPGLRLRRRSNEFSAHCGLPFVELGLLVMVG